MDVAFISMLFGSIYSLSLIVSHLYKINNKSSCLPCLILANKAGGNLSTNCQSGSKDTLGLEDAKTNGESLETRALICWIAGRYGQNISEISP